MTSPKRAEQNQRKTARYRNKMRQAGLVEVIVWATPSQAITIREMTKANRAGSCVTDAGEGGEAPPTDAGQ